MTRHISAEALARYREEDLGSRKSSRVQAHLAGCPRCTALDEDLAGVSVMLASAPQPAMPAEVTARIQAAITAEGARRARPGAGPEAGRTELLSQPGRSRHAAGRGGDGRGRRLGLLSPLGVRGLAAAAVAVVIAGGIYGTVQLAGGLSGASSSSASSAAGSARESGLHGAASAGPPLAYTSAGRHAEVTPVSTGLNFQPQQLKSQVRNLLQARPNLHASPRQPGAGQNSPLAAAPSAVPARRSFGGLPVSALQGCVMRISAGRKVLLVDVDHYQGRPATIIVVAGVAGGSQVWVVGPGCSGSDSDVIAQASLAGAG